MHYLIDGYNLLFRISRKTENSLLVDRQNLIELLKSKTTLLRISVTLVFDSHSHPEEAQSKQMNALTVYYTEWGETADEWILKHLKSYPKLQSIVVVTSDLRLACQIRQEGAKTLGCDAFWQWLNRPRLLKSKKSEKPKRALSPSAIPDPEATPETLLDYYLAAFQGNQTTPSQPEVKPLKLEEFWLREFQERLNSEEDEIRFD